MTLKMKKQDHGTDKKFAILDKIQSEATDSDYGDFDVVVKLQIPYPSNQWHCESAVLPFRSSYQNKQLVSSFCSYISFYYHNDITSTLSNMGEKLSFILTKLFICSCFEKKLFRKFSLQNSSFSLKATPLRIIS